MLLACGAEDLGAGDDTSGSEASGSSHAAQGGADQGGADQGGADQGGADQGGSDQGGANQGGSGTVPPPAPWDGSKVNVIGYYGNSGNAEDAIPLLTEVPCYYNILILTFANFDEDGEILFELQGPYANDLEQMKADIQVWKAQTDPYGRERKALFSIGGQNGHWPTNLTAGQVKEAINAFIDEYDLDGVDIDLEGGAVASASTLTDAVVDLRQKGMLVTAAPEAAQGPLEAYASILPYIDWVHPQFYNNGPNAVTTPYSPSFIGDTWVAPPTNWQDPTPAEYDGAGNPYWVSVLDTTSAHLGLSDSQKGMLIPTTTSAAGNNNDWDIALLKTQIENSKVRNVGTWAIAYDNEIGYTFAKTMAGIMDPDVTCPAL